MNIVVTGASGLLGRAFLARSRGYRLVAIGRADLNTNLPDQITTLAGAHRADVLINCAADTDVEGAERDPDHAHAVNAVLPGLLAESCARAGAMMVQISSTGCYGNWKTSPYIESDALRPTTVHHQTKALGEDAVRAKADRWMILRTGWLYGKPLPGRKDFVRDRLKEARTASVLFANAHQSGNPTFAEDVARQVYRLLEGSVEGVFNCVAHGGATRRDYVEAIVRAAGLTVPVQPAPDGHFVRRARVSPNEMAENKCLEQLGLDLMPDWREAVTAFVAKSSADEGPSDA